MSLLRSRREPPRDLCQKLGDHLLSFLRPSQLLELACRNPWPPVAERSCVAETCGRAAPRSCRDDATWKSPEDMTVAVAYDDAFGGYFPDVLDALEQRGVAVQDFSPLRDEALPADADVVYIGCGRPDLHLRELANNHCLMMALRDHVCAGKRIYAEGGGLAYLCQQVSLPSGEQVPMAGILPATARLAPIDGPPKPVELTLADDFWLGDRGQRVRGYSERIVAARADRPFGQLRGRTPAAARSRRAASGGRQPSPSQFRLAARFARRPSSPFRSGARVGFSATPTRSVSEVARR